MIMVTRLFFIISLFLMSALSIQAQMKIGHISSEYILKQLPDAQDAQKQLDALVVEWQNELNRMQKDWEKKYDEYDKKKLIMTEQRRADAERELRDLDQKIVDIRNRKFGQNGELFSKQNELMKPVQDRIFKVIQDVAAELQYDYVFDKSGEILLMYANPTHDLTQKVLEKLQVIGTIQKNQ